MWKEEAVFVGIRTNQPTSPEASPEGELGDFSEAYPSSNSSGQSCVPWKGLFRSHRVPLPDYSGF